MTQSLKPPRGIFVGIDLLFQSRISPAVLDTLLQLMALAWSSPIHQTPPVSLAKLALLTGKSLRTLRAHLAFLKAEPDVLRVEQVRRKLFRVTLAGWLYGEDGSGLAEADAPRRGRNLPVGRKLPRSVKEEEEYILDSDLNHSLHLLKKRPLKDSALPDAPDLPGSLVEALREAGLFASLVPEVARLAQRDGYSEADLLALLAWCRADEPKRPAALFIGRLRAGGRAPLEFAQPACPRCGQRGGHSRDCPRRYAEGVC